MELLLYMYVFLISFLIVFLINFIISIFILHNETTIIKLYINFNGQDLLLYLKNLIIFIKSPHFYV